MTTLMLLSLIVLLAVAIRRVLLLRDDRVRLWEIAEETRAILCANCCEGADADPVERDLHTDDCNAIRDALDAERPKEQP